MQHLPRQILLLFFAFSFITVSIGQNPEKDSVDKDFKIFQIEDLVSKLDQSTRKWQGVYENDNIMTGLYRLKVGAEDFQQPHDTDEIYYVLSGKAKFKTDRSSVSVQKGSILYVAAHKEHRFYDIEEELLLLVFFDR